LKLLGASAGCSLLSSCGGGGGGSVASDGGGGSIVEPPPASPVPTPNGYAFFKVFSPGDAGLSQIAALTPQIMLDDADHIVFYAQHGDGGYGLYQLGMRYAETRPRLFDARQILRSGQAIDGRVVSGLASADVNRGGHLATVLNFDIAQGPAGQGPSAVFIDRGTRLDKIVDYDDPIPGNHGSWGGDFGDVDLHDSDDVLLVARYGEGGDSAQGVFLLPGADEGNARVVVSSGQEIPQADGSIDNLGLIDLDDDGEYVVQAFGGTLMHAKESGPGSFVIHGNVGRPSSAAKLLSVDPTIPLTRAAKSAGAAPAVGTSLYGPRVGGPNVTAIITETPDGVMRLLRNNVVIAQTGQPSPGGSVIETMASAVVHRTGLTFYELATDVGLELCAHNGQQPLLLITRGAEVEGDVLDTIAFGFHTTMTDSRARIVCYAQAASGQEFILMGVPI
jgi:hypothetical protein